MRTVGQILKEARLSKNITLEDAQKHTKIRKELLEALENDDYNKLPPSTFIKGFIKNYGKYLGLNQDKLLAIFRREFSEQKNPPKVLQAWTNPIDKAKFRLTPAKVISGMVLILVVAFLGYLWFEYKFLVGSPFLEVISPADQITVQVEDIKVTGKTDPEAKVKINNQEVVVDFSGSFAQEIKLVDSANTITITSTSKYGKVTEETRTVFLKK